MKSRGFTLIELMVVVIVMAVLSGAIVPSIVSAMRRAGAKTAATKTFDLLNFACAAAIARGQPVVVNFDVSRGVCWASVQVLSLPWLEEDEEPRSRTLVSVELPEDVEISVYKDTESPHGPRSDDPWETIRFEPDGMAEDVVIELSDRRGDIYVLEVVGATGEVRYAEE